MEAILASFDLGGEVDAGRSRLVVRTREVTIPFGELVLARVVAIFTATHEDVLDVRRELERIAAPHHDVGVLAGGERPDAVRDAEDRRRPERHRAQRVVVRHPERHGVARFVLDVARVERFLVAAAGVPDERDFDAPVVSLSLGDTCLFRIGGTQRSDPTRTLRLASGDAVVLGADARLAFHGIDRIMPGTSTLLPQGGRINLTLRRVTRAS